MKYGCTLIFPKTDITVLEKHVIDVINMEWPENGMQLAKDGFLKLPILRGNGTEGKYPPGHKQAGGFKPGMSGDVIFIRPNANFNKARPRNGAPYVIWRDSSVQETEQNVYSGCYGKAILHAYAWHYQKTNKSGVSFNISGFQKWKEGERLGGSGGADPEKWADVIEDNEEIASSGQGAAALFGN